MEVGRQTLAQALAHYHGQFVGALQGIPRAVDREHFAYVLLCRLLLIYDLQVAGWLAAGDRWYLHNQLGLHVSKAQGSFFQSCLQPLCHQGFSLPPAERPKALSQRLGDIPYLGSRLFSPQPLEQQHAIDLPDESVEQFLGWLAEQIWQSQDPTPLAAESGSPDRSASTITRQTLAEAWELLLAESSGQHAVISTSQLGEICHQTVDAHLLTAATNSSSIAPQKLADLGSGMTDDVCRRLVTEVLPTLSMLDPACGSGRFLLMALERLQGVYQTCWDYAQTSPDPALQAWVRSLQSPSCPPQWAFTRQILTQNLYGVDVRPEAISIAQTQLWLRLLSTVQPGDYLPLLPDLDFNLIVGNALVGFIRVDAERFDQVAPKRSTAEPAPETVLQGNLLQPLAASSYRDTLVEKQIRVEHYRAQTQAMGTEGGIPEYAQREFLRDRIETVNAAAQQKLNDLLFETLSRQLGILVKEPHPSGRTRKRLLTPADIEALQPIHWGFAFNKVMSQGGFDLIITQAPEGTLRLRADEFYQQHREHFERLGIPLAAFRRSRRQFLQQQPELAAHWSTDAGRINCLRDYVRRSDDYPASGNFTARRSVSIKSLFAQRCASLAKADGMPVWVI